MVIFNVFNKIKNFTTVKYLAKKCLNICDTSKLYCSFFIAKNKYNCLIGLVICLKKV